MKQTATNSFNDGLNFDLHPIVTPNSVLTDNLNGTFITYNGNEFCLQNDRGNTIKATLSEGFIPIGVKEHNGVIYIVSYNEATKESEIGSYPGIVDWESKEGKLRYDVYTPLKNYFVSENRSNFRTAHFNFSSKHPVTINVQDSYDGSVNLILTDGITKPRIINTGFSVIGNNYKLITRTNDSNNYYDSTIETVSRLIQNSNFLTKFDLNKVSYGGQLKGGNYTFYLRYGDNDGNKTDIVCESSIVSIFKGTLGNLHSVSGTLADERTDKSIEFEISNIDTNFNKIYLSYSREYSDTNGYRMYECAELTDGYKISLSSNNKQIIIISGFEETTSISEEEINITYHTIGSAKTEATQQDMLFLGNVTFAEEKVTELQNYSYNVRVSVEQSNESIGNVNPFDYIDATNKYEYYNPNNIYYKLGYWPDEYYRLGIVYIKSDGTKTPVFNLLGCKLDALGSTNDITKAESEADDSGFFDKATMHNKYGVFKTPPIIIGSTDIIKSTGIYPWYFKFELTDSLPDGIIGYEIVRQKRIPVTILQGLKVGIEANNYIPMVQVSDDYYKTESFLYKNNDGKGLLKYVPESPTGSAIIASDEVFYQYFTIDCVEEGKSGTFPLNFYVTRDKLTKSISLVTYFVKDGPMDIRSNEDAYEITPSFPYLTIHWTKDTEANENKWLSELGSSSIHLQVLYHAYGGNGATYDFNNVADALLNYFLQNFNVLPDKDFENNQSSFDKCTRTILHDTRNVNVATVQLGSFGLLSLEPMIDNSIQSIINGGEIKLVSESNKFTLDNASTRNFTKTFEEPTSKKNLTVNAVCITPNSKVKILNNKVFKTIIGNSSSIKELGFIKTSHGNEYYSNYLDIIRGIYTPYVGIASSSVEIADYPVAIYSLRKVDIDSEDAFVVRMNNNAPFYAITDLISKDQRAVIAFRGDCFSTTQSHRIIRNFIDPDNPFTDKIVKETSWLDYYKGYNSMTDDSEKASDEVGLWSDINIGDINTVSLGHWVSFKCLSSYNLGLRAINTFNVTESSLLGTERKFWPLHTSTATADKVEDSYLLNDGYNSTVGRIRNIVQEDLPYVKDEFNTRIMFSNKDVTNAFVNGYRVFQGLSYRDYDKQYGPIVKLIPWGNNLFCVFEHGLSILPINEKALMQTTTEQTIHIYGHGVLPEQMSIVSQDYGSKYADSVIRTPIGIYGVDVDAKKIWRFSDKQGFETISDMKIESFLNETLKARYDINLDSCDVRSHFNSFKGDVIFTWYDGDGSYSICYNERQGLWTTRYNWLPIVSENINGEFYSLQNGEDSKGKIGIYHHDLENSTPTKWYGKQQPFEFEFVVSDPIGVHKIYENLQIISNNVQPEELTFEFIGDAYMFNKARIYHTVYTNHNFSDIRRFTNEFVRTNKLYNTDISRTDDSEYTKPEIANKNVFRNASILNDRGKPNLGRIVQTNNATEEYHLVIPQECRNIETWGRRLGNIHYKNDSWFTNIEPVLYDARLNDPNATFNTPTTKWNSARIRDKWCKIRVRYSGEDLAVITAIKTSLNI